MREVPRKLRLAQDFQRELTELIGQELSDPRVRGVSVTQVDLSPDLRNATVLVSSLGSESELAEAARVLNGAAPRLRRGVGSRLRLRYTAQLHFRVDLRLREADRVTNLIRNAVAEDERHAGERKES